MMAMISPSYDSFSESLSTLKFATRAKKIKNEAKNKWRCWLESSFKKVWVRVEKVERWIGRKK